MLICHPRRPSALVLMVRLADVVVVRLRLAGELIAGNAVRDVLRLTAHAAVSIEADRVVVRHTPSVACCMGGRAWEDGRVLDMDMDMDMWRHVDMVMDTWP